MKKRVKTKSERVDRRFLVLIPILFVALAAGAAAQDLTGTWDLQATVFLEQPEGSGGDCEYQGTTDFIQEDGTVTGDPVLDFSAGDSEICPDQLFGMLTGMVGEGTVGGTISGEQGALDFSGDVFDEERVQGQDDNVAGGFNVTQGPFAGSSGDFTGQRVAMMPTLAPWAVMTLALALLAAGSLLLVRRQQTV